MKRILDLYLCDEQLQDLISKKVKYIEIQSVTYPDLVITIKRSD